MASGEEAGQDLAEGPLEGLPDVVDGSADDVPRLVLGLEGLGQHRLAVDGGHAEEGRQPHPEDGAGAAGDHGGGAAGDVACAHLGGDGGCHRLEGAHALGLAGLLAVEVHAAEQPPEPLSELPHLHKFQADGEEDACAHQQIQQQIFVPQDPVDHADDFVEQFHFLSLFPGAGPENRNKNEKSRTCPQAAFRSIKKAAWPHATRVHPSLLCLLT